MAFVSVTSLNGRIYLMEMTYEKAQHFKGSAAVPTSFPWKVEAPLWSCKDRLSDASRKVWQSGPEQAPCTVKRLPALASQARRCTYNDSWGWPKRKEGYTSRRSWPQLIRAGGWGSGVSQSHKTKWISRPIPNHAGGFWACSQFDFLGHGPSDHAPSMLWLM